jgi:hypothetical protein
MTTQSYPGDLATPQQIRALADEYRDAAHLLLKSGKAAKSLTRAPFRLTAIHAIELYLSAQLLHRGFAAKKIRTLGHNLAARALDSGLVLRKRTAEHLKTLSERREYLITRYGPERAASTSQINRLTATLDEIAEKVTIALTTDASPKPKPLALAAR